jgi:hypothetical protein
MVRFIVLALLAISAVGQRWYAPAIVKPQSVGSTTLNSTTTAVGHCLMAHAYAQIYGVRFAFGSVTTGDTLTVSLQTSDSAGKPSGTVLASGSIVVTTGMANTEQQVTFGSAAQITAGQIYCVVYSLPGSPVGNFQIRNYYESWSPNVWMGVVSYSSGAWGLFGSDNSPSMVLLSSSDGKPYGGFTPLDYASNYSTTANVEVGNTCVATAPFNIVGMRLVGGTSSQTKPETTARIYVGGVLRGTATIPAQQKSVSNADVLVLFPSAVRVAPGTEFTLSIQAASGQQILSTTWLNDQYPPWRVLLPFSGLTKCISGPIVNGRVSTPLTRQWLGLWAAFDGTWRPSGGFVAQQ